MGRYRKAGRKVEGKEKVDSENGVRAGKQAGRLMGPVGQVVSAWELGYSAGTTLNDTLIDPAMDKFYRNRARIRAEKDARGMAILQADRSVAVQYRKLLAEKGVDEANVYLDRTVERRGWNPTPLK